VPRRRWGVRAGAFVFIAGAASIALWDVYAARALMTPAPIRLLLPACRAQSLLIAASVLCGPECGTAIRDVLRSHSAKRPSAAALILCVLVACSLVAYVLALRSWPVGGLVTGDTG